MAAQKKRKISIPELQPRLNDVPEVVTAFNTQWDAEVWLGEQNDADFLTEYAHSIEGKKIDKMAQETVDRLHNYRIVKDACFQRHCSKYTVSRAEPAKLSTSKFETFNIKV
jgi:hypothetical protein